MIKVEREGVYLVRRGDQLMVVEVLRSPEGRTHVAIHKTLRGRYELGEESEEWDILETDWLKDLKGKEIEFEELPRDVRRVISEAFPW